MHRRPSKHFAAIGRCPMSSRLIRVATLTIVVGAAGSAVAMRIGEPEAPPICSTFSICALDPATGETGVAVTTRVPEVGRLCPWVKADVGAVATQATVVVQYGPRGLELLEQGKGPEEVIQE